MGKMSPRNGDAVILFSNGMDGKLETTSEHAVCPLVRGEKWVIEWHFHFGFKHSQVFQTRTQPSVVFTSEWESPVPIFWVPPHGGAEVPMGEVQPGPENSKSFDSFADHVFHVRDEAGAILKKVVVGKAHVQRYQIFAEREF